MDTARRLQGEIEHLDAALRIFGHEPSDEDTVSPDPYHRTFHRGELQRLVMRAVREGPADAETLSGRVLKVLGWESSPVVASDLLQRVRGVLFRLRKRKVVFKKGDNWLTH